MKKVLIALAIAVIGFAASAANVTWKVSGVTAQGTATTEGYLTYFLMAADDTGAAAAKVWSIADAITAAGKKDADAFASHTIPAAKGLTDEGSVSSAKVTTYATSWVSPSASDLQYGYFYAVVFNADSVADATHYMVVGGAEADGSYALKFGTASANQSLTLAAGGASWTAVPEPTSGLLMLLGMAGLALRRRRA